MLIDTRSLSETAFDTDVCIVGAGPAGIAMARELIGQPLRVCLVESGGLKPDRRTQALSEGESIGDYHRPLDSVRDRCFGGTTQRWQRAWQELDDIDFETRAWLPESGWPFDKAHLRPYYRRARAVCRLNDPADEPETRAELAGAPWPGERLRYGAFEVSGAATFGEAYRTALFEAPNVHVLLQSTAVELEVERAQPSISGLRVATRDGRSLQIRARIYVLAAGGLENARLLLASNRYYADGIGNWYDLVGRHFMVHPNVNAGVFFARQPEFGRLMGWPASLGGTDVRFVLRVASEVQREEGLVNVSAALRPSPPEVQLKAVESFLWLMRESDLVRRAQLPEGFARHLVEALQGPSAVAAYAVKALATRWWRASGSFWLENSLEQTPNWNSRVLLARSRDEYGMHRLVVDWRLSSLEIHSLRRTHAIMAEDVAAAGLGVLTGHVGGDGADWPEDIQAVAHHMGTTRMHPTACRGVVDEESRVHGINNLYVTGSSTFPTSGVAHPTLTIVALALRLADHVKQSLQVIPHAETADPLRERDRVSA